MRIDLTREEHKELSEYLGRAYSGNYRADRYDTSIFDSMADKVFDAQPTVGDFKWQKDKTTKDPTSIVLEVC